MMAKKDEKMQINPDKFARAVVSGSNFTDKNDTIASKKALMRYLSAYYLVQKFNEMEADQFSLKNSADYKRAMKSLADLSGIADDDNVPAGWN